jgi:hypothetical protein
MGTKLFAVRQHLRRTARRRSLTAALSNKHHGEGGGALKSASSTPSCARKPRG